MSRAIRIALAVLIVGALGTFGVVLASGNDHDAAARHRWQAPRQCQSCHESVFAQWQGTHHQIAYLNPEVAKLSDDFRNKECQACHLPRPVFEVGLGKRTLPRLGRPDEGVDCLTCHLGSDGGIVSRHDVPAAPCRPRHHPAFDGVELCRTCHNQHQTTDQFEQSRYAAEGMTCNSCHMPPVTRTLANGRTKAGLSHLFKGAHDKDTLLAAAAFDVRLVDHDLQLTLTNHGAGHNYPTEERHRAVDMMVRFVDQSGKPGDWQLAWRFRQPYRDEPGENTQLPAGQSKAVHVPVPEHTTKIDVRLWYRSNPFAKDGDAASTLLIEKELSLP